MEIITTQFGSLGPLLTATASFFNAAAEDEEGFIRPVEAPYLDNIPCMPATGRNTRQDGLVYVAIAGQYPYESKWSAIDLTEQTRGVIQEEHRCIITKRNRLGEILAQDEFVVAGVTEYDSPDLGFAFALLTLRDKK